MWSKTIFQILFALSFSIQDSFHPWKYRLTFLLHLFLLPCILKDRGLLRKSNSIQEFQKNWSSDYKIEYTVPYSKWSSRSLLCFLLCQGFKLFFEISWTSQYFIVIHWYFCRISSYSNILSPCLNKLLCRWINHQFSHKFLLSDKILDFIYLFSYSSSDHKLLFLNSRL